MEQEMILHGQVWIDKMYICRPIPGERMFAPVAILTRYEDEDNNQHWTIEPLWENYKPKEKGGYGFDIDNDEIFSIDMEAHKDKYTFINHMPGIVDKRMPPKKRGMMQEFYDKLPHKLYDEIEILKITKGICNDKFIFVPFEDIYQSKFSVPEIKEQGIEDLMFNS